MTTFTLHQCLCRNLLITFSFLFISGCSSWSTDQFNDSKAVDISGESTVLNTNAVNLAYECEKSFQFVASVEPDQAWLFFPGKTTRLPVAVSASGARFSDGVDTYWSAKDEALFEYQGKPY